MTTRLVTTTAMLCGLAFGALPQAAEAGTFTEIRPATLKYNGVKYWRKKANDAKLGSVGKKMTPAAGKNYFQHLQNAPNGLFKVKVGDWVSISTSKKSEFGVSAAAGNGAVKGKAGGKRSGQYNGSITAFKLKIDLGNSKGALRYEANRNHKYLTAIKEQGNKARMVTAVWILVSGDESQAECLSGNLGVSDTTGTVSVSTEASSCTSSSWVMPPGSIIAYEMTKVTKWDKDELTKKPDCKSGAKYDVRTSPLHPKDRCETTKTLTSGVKCKLLVTDKKKNWYVKAKSGKDTCKSKKGKKDKGVKCVKSGYSYKTKSGKDECTKSEPSYVDPTCPAGYDYDKKSTGNKGVDVCKLKGIEDLKPDSMDGF